MKQLMTKVATAILMSLVCSVGYADSPAPNTAYKAFSANKEFSVEMTPEEGWGGYGTGQGIVYRFGEDKEPQKLWTLDFFSSQVALTNDGKRLIALGPWASQLSDLAIVFYSEGKELKRYTVGDLIHDEARLQKTVSHFFWRAGFKPLPEELSQDQKTLTLKWVDGSVLTFEVETGNIKDKN